LSLHLTAVTAIITVTIVRLVGQIKSRTYGGEERGGRGRREEKEVRREEIEGSGERGERR
jgi:hypothetical protein